MDSDNKSEGDDHDRVSSQILDYYKRYSQSRQLPKYFSGASVAYMPEIVKSDEIVEATGEVSCAETLVEKTVTEQGEARPVSSASSITSNRKLEWDNGADIGYGNYKDFSLHKSVSLPILTSLETNVETGPIPKLVVSKNSDSNPSDENLSHRESSSYHGEVVQKEVSSSSSDPVLTYSNSGPQLIQSKSSSNSDPQLIKSKSSSSSSQPLTQSKSSSSNFDNTLAYLKSKIGTPEAESTPKIESNYVETPVATKVDKVSRKKIVNLCVTNPVTLECVDRGQLGNNKKIQTSIVGNLTKSVQTGNSLEKSSEKNIAEVSHQPPKTSGNDNLISNSTPQTDSDIVASRCDSFEFSYGGNYGGGENNVSSLKRSKAKSDLASSSASSETHALANLIASNQSNSLITDIDKSIELLQKLLKSKKYDSATKKRYVKRIVAKIVNSKYIEDSTSSSDWFVPKTSQDNSQCEKVQNDAETQQKLQENLPWYPAQIDPSSRLTVKAFSSEFLPKSDNNKGAKKKSIFTIATPEATTSTQSTPPSLLQPLTSSSSSWKDDKTLSEKVLEAKKGQGDQLVKFAMKERSHQIAWINNEISHLSKLKCLLEKSSGHRTRQKFQEIKKTTTVYMMSNNYDKSRSTSSSGSNRKYVIETELESSGTSDRMDFNFCDKDGQRNYQVKELVGKNSDDGGRRKIMGDIEVISDDQTTNIRVKAKKMGGNGSCPCGGEFKPKQPSLVGSGTYPRSNQSSKEYKRDNCDDAASKRSNSGDRRAAAITKKVADILEKYTSKSGAVSSSGTDKESYQCKSCRIKNDCCKNVQYKVDCHCKEISAQTRDPKILNEGVQCKINCRCKDSATQPQPRKTCCECAQCSCEDFATQAEVPKKLQRKVDCLCEINGKSSSSKTNYQSGQCKIDCCKCNDIMGRTKNNRKSGESGEQTELFQNVKTATSQPVIVRICHEGIQCKPGCRCKEFSIQTEFSKPKSVNTSRSQFPKVCHESVQCKPGCRCKESCIQTEIPKLGSGSTSTNQFPKICHESVQCKPGCRCKEFGGQTEIPKPGSVNPSANQFPRICHESVQCKPGCRCKEFGGQTEIPKPGSVNPSANQFPRICHESVQCKPGCRCKESGVQTEISKPENVNTSNNQFPKVCHESFQCKPGCKCKESSNQTELVKENIPCQPECFKIDNKPVQRNGESSSYTQETSDSRRRPISGQSEDSSTSSSSSSDQETLASGSESLQSCLCCKRKNSALYTLRKKLSDQTYPLCRPCYQQKSRFLPEMYSNPGHICNCYTVVETKTLNEIKKTINDLNELDRYCTCVNNKNRNSGGYCRYCKCKLKKTSKNKDGIAYMLTFEDVSIKEAKAKKMKRKKAALEEIKIKIPVLHKKKKDKENKKRREAVEGGSAGCSKEPKPNRIYTLQEHLHKNRPDFVEVAEERRKTVVDSRNQREEATEKKKMLMLQNNWDNNYQNPRRLFSSKEMKEITRKNYQKLPEVQQKLIDQKEGQIRQANRLIVNTFNRKMKENVLKGKINLPTNINIVNL